MTRSDVWVVRNALHALVASIKDSGMTEADHRLFMAAIEAVSALAVDGDEEAARDD